MWQINRTEVVAHPGGLLKPTSTSSTQNQTGVPEPKRKANDLALFGVQACCLEQTYVSV
jgi:hypothetical protein